MLILRQSDVRALVEGREREITQIVADAYAIHAEGATSLPHSVFLRFPDRPRDRIIGLPAYLGGPNPAAGMKWIASVPGNIGRGLERASAAIVLNDVVTGRPDALIEGSVISAKRTAASAALAARLLTAEPAPEAVSLIGCGVINLEVLRFLRAELPQLVRATVHDLDPARAAGFARRATDELGIATRTVGTAAEALAAHRLVSLATTAATPHLDLAPLAPGSTVLHVSLRDISVADMLAAQNVVDDTDHVNREGTSVHLASQASGGTGFVDAEIGDVVRDPGSFRRDPDRTLIYSPFGLGILDMALAAHLRREAGAKGLGVQVDDFVS
ncbi:2,3-diaminopropionate biosynthesis protein SbnB [Catenulispora sp. GP43]|uniref:2,3-diaminopropionate biosynthesis protein SbnB n=1 Tax=Catenulispora sp. GP43 TaxID=3156263 RepID=UPI003513F6CA